MTLRRSTKGRQFPRWHNKPTEISASIKTAAQRTLGSRVRRVLILVVMVAGTVTLILGCERSAKKASSKLTPTPETDPLAQPKSLQQVGAPVEMTREKIPADNPQTPEKISLGQRLFLDPRLSVDGTISCSTCHDPKLAFTDRRPPPSASKAASANAMPQPF